MLLFLAIFQWSIQKPKAFLNRHFIAQKCSKLEKKVKTKLLSDPLFYFFALKKFSGKMMLGQYLVFFLCKSCVKPSEVQFCTNFE